MFDFLTLFRPRPPQAAPVVAAVAAPPSPVSTSSIPLDAMTFVEAEEDGSPAYYLKTESHWSWPGGASGPTIGVGYDCGYVTRQEAINDWSGIVDTPTLAAILLGVGLKGAEAQSFVAAHRNDITITWVKAVAEFTSHEVPKWLTRCRAALPNFDLLPGECQGAIFSLSYNRGTGGYDDPSQRDVEMREIKAAMIAKNFAAIPPLIESMRRLWPQGGDLWNRRMHEAQLFRKGLNLPASTS